MKKFQAASFFSGIGGFDLGFEEAGFKVNFQCEIQQFCNDVLLQHWPNTLRAGDIAAIDAESIPNADVWCGGFPCQDLSVARGSLGRHGLNGSRSGLFFSLAAHAQKKKPRVILIENVYGLLNSNNGKDFPELLHILGSLNYAVSWRVLNSRYFGVPQSRPRVYICAWLNDPIAAGSVLFEDRSPSPPESERSAFIETSWLSGSGPIVPKVAFCLAATSGRHTGTDWSRTYIAYKKEVRRFTPLECERLQGFPDGWTGINLSSLDPERCDSLRYHALGNAVSVPVIKWIAARIRNRLQLPVNTKKKIIGRRDFLSKSVQIWPGLIGPARVSGELSSIRNSATKIIWQNAGILWDGMFITNRTPPSPHKPILSDLLDIVEKNRPDQRYFLSQNAAEGILRRVNGQGRQLFPPLHRALERLSGREASLNPSIQRPAQQELPICVLP